MFWQNKPAFGTSSAFGSTPSGGGLFGQQNKSVGFTTAQPGGLFGQTTTPASTGLFGQSTPAQSTGGGLFGASSTTSTGFGTQAATGGGGLFGQSTTGGLFGQGTSTTGNRLFGATSTPAAGGLFGATAAAPAGTTVKFDPLVSQDTMMRNNTQTSIQTKHQCITAMKAYETKSLEELRVDDYLANRKGAQGATSGAFGAPATGGLFGSTPASTATSGGLFGQSQAKPLFGATATTAASTGLFGNTSAATSGGLFGQAAKPTTGGLFGAQPATSNVFGAPAASSASTGLFGAKPATGLGTTGGGLFGNTATAPPAFGQQPTSSAFGMPAASTGGLFGGTKPAFGATTTTTASGGGLFGSTAPATGGLFGNTAKPAFGAPTSVGTGLFGATATSAAPAFGATAPVAGGGLFGNTAAKPGGLFGSATPATGGGLFGSTQPAASSFGASGGLFGNSAVKPGGLTFGAPAPAASSAFGAPAPAAGPPAPLTLDPSSEARAAFQNQLEYLACSPYGDVLKPLKPAVTEAAKATDPMAHARVLNASSEGKMKATGGLSDFSRPSPALLRTMPRVANSPRILGGLNRSASLRNTPSANRSIFADLEAETKIMKEGFVTRRRNVKKLVLPVKPKTSETLNTSLPVSGGTGDVGGTGEVEIEEELPALIPTNAADSVLSPPPLTTRPTGTQPPVAMRTPVTRLQDRLNDSTATNISVLHDSLRGLGDGVGDGHGLETIAEREPSPPPADHPTGIKLTRPEYYTVPEMSELAELLDDNGNCIVTDGFTVGRLGYGSVFWAGSVNVAGLDLDAIVHFRHKEVTVYPDDTRKPPEGQELNRPAEVTLEGVWPRDKASGEPIQSGIGLERVRWRERLETAAGKMGAAFLDFRPETGAWVFRVPHFTKYGLEEEDEPEFPVGGTDSSPKSVQNLVQRSPIPADTADPTYRDAPVS